MRSNHPFAAGVPAGLRKVTRWALIALCATLLVGQLVGLPVIAPAQAGAPPPFGQFNSDCVRGCNYECAYERGVLKQVCREACIFFTCLEPT
jgi:hypothetical protein